MEVNSDGDVAEQIFYDTVREYVVSFKLSVFLYFVKILSTKTAEETTKRQAQL